VPVLRILIETSNAVFEERLDRRVLRRLSVPRLDRGDVVAVDQEVVRIDIARTFTSASTSLVSAWSPRRPTHPRSRCRHLPQRDDWNRGCGALQENSAAVFASTIDFSHGCPPLDVFLLSVLAEAATFLDHLDLVAVGVRDEEKARKASLLMLEIPQRPGRQFLSLEAGVLESRLSTTTARWPYPSPGM